MRRQQPPPKPPTEAVFFRPLNAKEIDEAR